MGHWVNDKWFYSAKDIGDIIEIGYSKSTKSSGDWKDMIGELADVRRAMDALKIKWQLNGDAANYQYIADYLNGAKE